MTYQLMPGEILACHDLGRDGFREFLREPSLDTLYTKCRLATVLRKSESIDGYIVFQNLAPTTESDSIRSGIYRVGAWPIYTEFIDFMNDTEGFEDMLLKHDIKAEVLSSIIFSHWQYAQSQSPGAAGSNGKACIWLHTSSGDYFLQHNAYLAESPLDVNYTYDFYDLTGYIQKLGFDDLLP